jgi:hypothetical protein
MADPADDPLESLRTASSFAVIDAVLSGAPGGAGLSLREHTAEMDYFVAALGLRGREDPRHILAHIAGLLAFHRAEDRASV